MGIFCVVLASTVKAYDPFILVTALNTSAKDYNDKKNLVPKGEREILNQREIWQGCGGFHSNYGRESK